MKELMMNEEYADVTLVTEDKKQIKANINVLSACSPVFKDILKKEKNCNQIIYLRGIQFPEMESILQFIYLGEATFYEQRMDEFLAVAKLLEIKEICNVDPDRNDQPDDEPIPSEHATLTVEEHTVVYDQIIKQGPKERRREVIDTANKYECVHCHKSFYDSSTKRKHERSVHEGVKYACGQCDQQFTSQGSLSVHIQSIHEGVKYACDQCGYQATQQRNLTRHIHSMHQAVKYAYDL